MRLVFACIARGMLHDAFRFGLLLFQAPLRSSATYHQQVWPLVGACLSVCTHSSLYSYDWKNAAVYLTRLLEPHLAYAAFVLILEALKTGGFASLLAKKDRSLKAFVVYSDHDIVVPCDGVIRVMYFTKVILLFVQFDVNLREVVCAQEWLLVGVIGYVEEARLLVEASG